MMQTHSLEKLFQGKPLRLDDKKEIANFFEGHHRKKPLLFTKKNKLEQQIFEKYIKNFNLQEFSSHFFENCLLFLKKDLSLEEEEKLKNFKILNYLIETIELENNLKNKLLNKMNEIEIFNKFKNSEKKELVNIIINFSSEINAYNNTI
jgi:hypothetical protein